MKDIRLLGIKVSRNECVCTRINRSLDWRTYKLYNQLRYDNVIWMPSRSHTDEALLLLSLGLGKQEIEEYFNTNHDYLY